MSDVVKNYASKSGATRALARQDNPGRFTIVKRDARWFLEEVKVTEVKKFRGKRGQAFEALTRPEGVTLEQGVAMLGWSVPVVRSEYYEVARAAQMQLVKEGARGSYVYRLA
jgi:hypothetical protein